jgi:hypothetical protein
MSNGFKCPLLAFFDLSDLKIKRFKELLNWNNNLTKKMVFVKKFGFLSDNRRTKNRTTMDHDSEMRGGWRPRSQSKIVNGVHKIVNGGHNCERRSQNRQNKFEFYASYHFLTISFLLLKLASHPRSLLHWMTRSECIFKNFRNQIVNAVHKFSAFCERRSQNCERRSQLWTWAPRSPYTHFQYKIS